MTVAHEILLASAGTGKTFRLVHRVLTLLLAGAPLEELVATTFTRKAAGQILERVLERLVEAVGSDDARRDVGQRCGRPELTRAECLALLGTLARSIHAARVSTLDAWFHRAVSLRALELGLPPGWSLADGDEDRALRIAAVSRLVRELPPEELTGLLAEVRGQSKATARGVHDAVLDVVGKGLDLLHAAAPEAWSVWSPPPPPSEREVRAALAELAAFPLPRKKTDDQPLKTWVAARDAIVDAVTAALDGGEPDLSLLGKGLLGKVLDGESQFYQRTIEPELATLVQPLVAVLAAPLLDEVAHRTRSRHALLLAFDERYREAKLAARRQGFDDLPRLLAGDDGLANPALAVRGLGRVTHLLLDEFQDTSLPQWLVLEPLARALFAQRDGERSVFCVGDVKQSIYGWRGGEPRLLAGLGETFDVPAETLPDNYRSAPVVLAAVSQVMSAVSHWGELADQPALLSAATRWDAQWPEHRAARSDLPGQVSLWQAGDPEHDTRARFAAVVERAADLAAEAAAAAPEGLVGVLVRGNKPIPRLLHALRRRGVAASGEGGNPVTDAEAVQLALSALHLADHPGDGFARLHVASSPFGAALELTRHDDDGAAVACARRLRRALANEGYGALLSRWQRDLVESDARFGPWDRRRFAQLVELGTAWDARATLRPSDFVSHVRARPVEDAASGRVKVMTVHAAKGLEFHAVVLPELHGGLRVGEMDVLVGHADPMARPDTVVTGARKDHVRLDARLAALADETSGRAFDESLCLLYVALTRAMRRLDVVLMTPGARDAKLSHGALLRARLAPDVEPDEQGLLWRAPGSVDDWAAGIAAEGEPAPVEPEPVLALPPSPAPRTLPARSPSALEGGASRSGSALLARRVEGGLRYGTALHALLEQVEWLDTFALDDGTLAALLGAGAGAEAAARLADFRAALARPAIAALLTRPDDGALREVWRERAFALRLDDGDGPYLLRGSFDRLVVTRAGDSSSPGAALSAEVVDWKTDAVDDPAVRAERVGYYAPQLQAYRRAAAALLSLDLGAVTCRLAFVGSGVVVDV